MQEDARSGLNPEEQEWLHGQQEREGKRKKKLKREDDSSASLNINSLMDIMVIMLVFLLKNFGDEPIKAMGEDLKVPTSDSQLMAEDTTAVTVSRNAILVNDKLAVDLKNGAVDQSQKRGGERGMVIQPLFEELTDAINKKKRETTLLGQTYEPVATIVADQTTPYRLITEVMYTAGQAELRQFKFAVIKGNFDTFGGPVE